jgi:tripartite-type tricarboxylate transporter receptor subunit TctC
VWVFVYQSDRYGDAAALNLLHTTDLGRSWLDVLRWTLPSGPKLPVPEVPTLAESGLPGFRSVTWFAIVAPPGTPSWLADKVNRDVVESLKRPEVAARLQTLSLDPMIGTPAEVAKFLAEESRVWGKVIAEAGIKVE